MSYDYLASPYSHDNPLMMEARYFAVRAYTASLLAQRIWVYSPIVHCHELATRHNLPKDAAFWREYNEAMLETADQLIVLQLAGWEESKGVSHERVFAEKKGKRVHFVTAYEFATSMDGALLLSVG